MEVDDGGKPKGTTPATAGVKNVAAKKEPRKGPNGADLWDLGGDGDCGFRVVSAAMASHRGQDKQQAETKTDGKRQNLTF